MKKNNKFGGVYTALITPFLRDAVDFKSLEKLVHFQKENGVVNFVVNGTTGESPTLEVQEVKEIFQCVRSSAGSTSQLILGIGTNNTRTTVAWAQHASAWGANGALAVVPYYNKPPQRGLVSHFKTVAQSCDVPVVLYNVPGRTVAGLDLKSIVELSQVDRIVGIKESTGDIALMRQIRSEAAPDFALLSGDDGTCVEFCLKGGDGVISVCSHVIPKQLVDHIEAARSGDVRAAETYKQFDELMKQLYIEANPIPVKKALHLMGIIASDELRLPLTALADSYVKDLSSCLGKIQA